MFVFVFCSHITCNFSPFLLLLSVYLSIRLCLSLCMFLNLFLSFISLSLSVSSLFVCLLSVYLSIRLVLSLFMFLNLFLSFISLSLSVSYLCLFPRCQAACQSNSCAKIRHDLSLHMQATIIFLFQICSKIILF